LDEWLFSRFSKWNLLEEWLFARFSSWARNPLEGGYSTKVQPVDEEFLGGMVIPPGYQLMNEAFSGGMVISPRLPAHR
jgi:hypothetical protein